MEQGDDPEMQQIMKEEEEWNSTRCWTTQSMKRSKVTICS